MAANPLDRRLDLISVPDQQCLLLAPAAARRFSVPAHMCRAVHLRRETTDNRAYAYGHCHHSIYACAVISRRHSTTSQPDVIICRNAFLTGSATANHTAHFTSFDASIEDQQRIASLLREQISLSEGRRVHVHVLITDLDRDDFIGVLLLNMYSRCGALEDAEDMFLSMPKTNVVSWNSMISAYAHHGCKRDALRLFREMQASPVKPTKVTFMSVLHACDSPAALAEGWMIHEQVVQNGLEFELALGTAIVSMYGRCCAVSEAYKMFNKLPLHNVVSWTAMISVYAGNDNGNNAYKLFQKMPHESVVPNKITFLSILGAINDQSVLVIGEDIHACIINSGCEADVVLGTALLNMYGKCGALVEARWLFDSIRKRTIVSWNAMIDAYAQKEGGKEAVDLFHVMQHTGMKPDKATFVSILTACSTSKSLTEGEQIHALLKKSRFEMDVVLATALVNMYSKCGALEQARAAFDEMHHRNVVTWNALIIGYMEHGRCRDALLFFCCMLEEGVMVDKITYLGVMSACETLEDSKMLHARCFGTELESDTFVGTAIINMFGKCGDLRRARMMFDRMHQPNIVTWNAMMCVYMQQGHAEEALVLFNSMQQKHFVLNEASFVSILTACASMSALVEGQSVHTWILYSGFEEATAIGTALISMYGKSGALQEACAIFSSLPHRTTVTWNAMIGVYVQHGHNHEALQLFHEMKKAGVQPDRITFVSTLSACSDSFALIEGRAFHSLAISNGFESDMDVGTALLTMYGKCGFLQAAHAVFNKLHERNIMSWNAMMAVYAQHGLGEKAFQLFIHMLQENQKPDGVTFLSLLSACSHAGLLDEGLHCLVSMTKEYSIRPTIEHFACVVDLFGRSGKLLEAERFIYKMGLQCHSLAWMTLLGACKLHNDLEQGKIAAEHAMDLNKENAAPYILLSSMYAKNGRWDEFALLRERMSKNGVKIPRGFSRIIVNNNVVQFFAGDTTHPESVAIYTTLDNLLSQFQREEYLPYRKKVLFDEEEKENEKSSCYHSEKLALAYGLTYTPPGAALHVIKNLRVCSDCHTFMKFVSKISMRNIAVKDSYVNHQFRNGLCMCEDSW